MGDRVGVGVEGQWFYPALPVQNLQQPVDILGRVVEVRRDSQSPLPQRDVNSGLPETLKDLPAGLTVQNHDRSP